MFNNRFKPGKRGISTFIAVLLLMVLAVAAGVLIYAYTMGYLGSMTNVVPQVGALEVQSVAQNPANGDLWIYLENIGKGSVKVDPADPSIIVYIDGSPTPFTSSPTTIAEGATSLIDVPITATVGTTHTFKIVSKDGTTVTTMFKTTIATSGQGQYSVTFNMGSGGGSVSPTGTQSYTAGQAVPISATAGSGYTFSSWTATGSITFTDPNTASTTATINGAGSITANFVASGGQYSVTFNMGSGGGSIIPTGTQSYTAGQAVSISATAGSGYTFSSWTATGSITFTDSSASSTTATINGAGTITANFAVTGTQYSVQFALGSGGASMSPTGTQSYAPGTAVPISATPSTGHVFSSWSATGSITFTDASAASTTATINGAGTITANFVAQYSVSFVLGSGGQSMSPSSTQLYAAGAAVPVTATASPGYVFSSWTATGSIAFDDPSAFSTMATISGAGTITANFAMNAINKFVFSPISSPQTAGTPITFTITAEDISGNTLPGYSSSVPLSASSGTMTPTSTGTSGWSLGVWTGSVTFTTTGSSITITADDGSGHTGTSTTFAVNAGPLSQFAVVAPASVNVGNAFTLTVTAQDSYGNTVTSYSSPVGLSISGTGSTMSPTSTGTTGWASGVWKSNAVTVSASVGSGYTITADDGSGHTGTSNTFNVGAALVLDHFVFSTISSPQTAGTAINGITITAVDVNGVTLTGYVSSTTLTETGGGSGGSVTPSSVTFVSGVWTGSLTVTKSGTGVTITATFGSVSTPSNTFTVNSGSLASFGITVPASCTSHTYFGSGNNVVVTAYDAYGNVKTDYTGSVYFTSSDTNSYVRLPYSSSSRYTFTTGDAGVHTFTSTTTSGFRLITVPSQTITVTDGTISTQSAAITVNPGTLNQFNFSTIPSPQTAGVAFSITITAQDRDGNTVTSYVGTNTLTASSGTISPTSTTAFTAGVWTGSVTMTSVGSSRTIGTSGGGYTGTSNTFTINAGSLDHFVFNTISTPQTAGVAFSITITAKDTAGNTVTSYTGNPTLTYSAGTISPTTTGAFAAGTKTVSVTVTTAGTGVTITATDGSATGTSNTFDVNLGVDHFVFSTISSPQTAGTAITGVTITAVDINGNTVTGYINSVPLSASSGTISPTSTGTSGWSSGVWTGSATVTMAGSGITITANDGSGHTGTSNTFTVNAGAASKLVYTVAPTTVVHNVVSTVFTVQLEDQYSNPTTSTGSITVSLTSSASSGNRYFYSDAGGTTQITTVTIAAGSSSANFYFKDTETYGLPRSRTVTASSGTLTSAVATITIT